MSMHAAARRPQHLEPLRQPRIRVDEQEVARAREAAGASRVRHEREQHADQTDVHGVSDRHRDAIAAAGEPAARVQEGRMGGRGGRDERADQRQGEEQRAVGRRGQRAKRESGRRRK